MRDTYYYAAAHDVLVRDADVVIVNNLDVLTFLDDENWIVGARYALVHVPYRGPDERPGTLATQHRVGPMVGYSLWKNAESLLDSSMLVAVANWYLQHPYRAGKVSSQALPYLAVAWVLQGAVL